MSDTALSLTHEDLDSAFKKKQLYLVFQPKVSLSRLLAGGAEAYIRWQHPKYGLLLPGLFLPFVEQEGRARELTLFVLREALGAAARWRREGLGWTVAVNIGASDVVDGTLPTSINILLEEFDLPADALSLDIPESEVARNQARVLPTLLDLRARGCGVALDSGQNPITLDSLEGLPLTEIKISGSAAIQFVERIKHTGHGKIAARLERAKKYNLPSSAVGVENEATLWALQRAGFDNAQGLYICKPMPADEVKRWDAVWRKAAQSLRASKDNTAATGPVPEQEVAVAPGPEGRSAPPIPAFRYGKDKPEIRTAPAEIAKTPAPPAKPPAPQIAPPQIAAPPAIVPPKAVEPPPPPAWLTQEAPKSAPSNIHEDSLHNTPRAVRGPAPVGDQKKPGEAESMPLVARKIRGLDKPITMSVTNPGRQGLFKRK